MINFYFNYWPNLVIDFIKYFLENIILILAVTSSLALCIYTLYKIIIISKQINYEEKRQKELIDSLKTFYKSRLMQLEDKEAIKSFVNFIETFGYSGEYKDIKSILKNIGLSDTLIQEIIECIYNAQPAQQTAIKLKTFLKDF